MITIHLRKLLKAQDLLMWIKGQVDILISIKQVLWILYYYNLMIKNNDKQHKPIAMYLKWV